MPSSRLTVGLPIAYLLNASIPNARIPEDPLAIKSYSGIQISKFCRLHLRGIEDCLLKVRAGVIAAVKFSLR
jgi:hypothetical protein